MASKEQHREHVNKANREGKLTPEEHAYQVKINTILLSHTYQLGNQAINGDHEDSLSHSLEQLDLSELEKVNGPDAQDTSQEESEFDPVTWQKYGEQRFEETVISKVCVLKVRPVLGNSKALAAMIDELSVWKQESTDLAMYILLSADILAGKLDEPGPCDREAREYFKEMEDFVEWSSVGLEPWEEARVGLGMKSSDEEARAIAAGQTVGQALVHYIKMQWAHRETRPLVEAHGGRMAELERTAGLEPAPSR